MLRIVVQDSQGNTRTLDHRSGPLEFGRGPERDVPRCLLDDLAVSRDHLTVEQYGETQLRIENLSRASGVPCSSGRLSTLIDIGQQAVVDLPVQLTVGNVRIAISHARATCAWSGESPCW